MGVAALDGGKVRAMFPEVPSSLEMKGRCERCGEALDAAGSGVDLLLRVLYCAGYAGSLGNTCPNCRKGLVRRPRWDA